jgi:hypothetical protein
LDPHVGRLSTQTLYATSTSKSDSEAPGLERQSGERGGGKGEGQIEKERGRERGRREVRGGNMR